MKGKCVTVVLSNGMYVLGECIEHLPNNGVVVLGAPLRLVIDGQNMGFTPWVPGVVEITIKDYAAIGEIKAPEILKGYKEVATEYKSSVLGIHLLS